MNREFGRYLVSLKMAHSVAPVHRLCSTNPVGAVGGDGMDFSVLKIADQASRVFGHG